MGTVHLPKSIFSFAKSCSYLLVPIANDLSAMIFHRAIIKDSYLIANNVQTEMMPSWGKYCAYMSWQKQRNYLKMCPEDILKCTMELLSDVHRSHS